MDLDSKAIGVLTDARNRIDKASEGVPGAGAKTRAEAKSAAEDFEAVFITQMLEQMWAGVPTDGPFGGGHSEGVFRSFMLQEYGKSIARSGGIGLADNVYREILARQEIPNE
ncbi:MAG: chemotaxis protein [Alphaproteobacteria bacterium]|nr:chemotaxis protein [Alphaproteobacteria bacterium]